MKKSTVFAAAACMLVGGAAAVSAQMPQDRGYGKPLGGVGVNEPQRGSPDDVRRGSRGDGFATEPGATSGSSAPPSGTMRGSGSSAPPGPAGSPGIVNPQTPNDPLTIQPEDSSRRTGR